MEYLLGIDLGTSSLKSILIDADGSIQAISSKSYQFASPRNGYAEDNPCVWWNACCETLRDVLKESGIEPEEIKSVSFSGQMHGLVALDKEYQIVRPSILHCDARSSVQVEKIKQILGEDKTKTLVMNPIYTGFLLPSLLWVKEEEPKNYERIRHVMLPKDYIKYRMTGEISTDYSDASATLAFDIQRHCWSREILDAVQICGIHFPKCYDTTAAVGYVSRQASEETGLSVKTLVVAGGGDQVMQGIGNGITAKGEVSVNIGTSGQVSFQSDVPILNPQLNTNTFCGYQKGRWITMGAIMNAGLSYKWFNGLFEKYDFNEMNEKIA